MLHNPLYPCRLAMLIALVLTVISMPDYFVKAKRSGFAPRQGAKRRAGAESAAGCYAGEDEAGRALLSAQRPRDPLGRRSTSWPGAFEAGAAGATVGTAELTGGPSPRRSPTCRVLRTSRGGIVSNSMK